MICVLHIVLSLEKNRKSIKFEVTFLKCVYVGDPENWKSSQDYLYSMAGEKVRSRLRPAM